MNKKSQITIGLALLIMASLLCGSVNAQVPVTDSQNTKSTIKNWFTNLKESKVVVSTMNTAKKTSAAIGTAKKAVSEYVLENKKKIEEKMAKVKEYKEKAEKYKEDYEKYKAQLDEGIAKAKEMKEQAEQGIQTAKDTAAAAKGMADAAKDKVNSKLGREDGTADGFVAENNVTEDLSAAPDNGAQEVSAESSVSAGSAAAQPVVQAKPAVSQVVTSRRPFGSAAASVSGAVGTVSAGAAGGSGTISAAVPGGQIAVAPSAVVKIDNAGIAPVSGAVASVEEAAEETAAGVSGQAALQDAAVKDLTASPAEMPTEAAQLSVGSQVKDAVAVASDKAGAAAASGADNKVIGGKTLSAAPAKAAAVRAVDGKASVVQSREIKDRPQAAEPMPAPAVRTLQAVPQQNSDKIKRKSLRRTFTTSSLEGFGQISGAAPVGFAYALELPDDCSDVNNTRVFPRTTCMYCGLSSSKAKSKGAIDECLLSINKESVKAQAYSGRDAPKAYRKGKLEIAAAMIAESYRAANKAETFYDNKVAPIAEAPEAVEQDALANLVEFNKVINEQLNDLMQLYSSKLTLQAYMNYGKYNFKPEEEEDEE